jgi:hypothetical protein
MVPLCQPSCAPSADTACRGQFGIGYPAHFHPMSCPWVSPMGQDLASGQWPFAMDQEPDSFREASYDCPHRCHGCAASRQPSRASLAGCSSAVPLSASHWLLDVSDAVAEIGIICAPGSQAPPARCMDMRQVPRAADHHHASELGELDWADAGGQGRGRADGEILVASAEPGQSSVPRLPGDRVPAAYQALVMSAAIRHRRPRAQRSGHRRGPARCR